MGPTGRARSKLWPLRLGVDVVALRRTAYYHVYKFMRRKARTGDRDHMIPVWPSIIPTWRMWLNELAQAPRRHLATTAGEVATIFTDASLSGWGAMVFSDAGEIVLADAWHPRERTQHINVLEMRALRRALECWQTGLITKVHIKLDNTVAISTHQRGRSGTYALNAELARTQQVLEEKNLLVLSISYVRSAENPADIWSRITQPDTISKKPHTLTTTFAPGQLASATLWHKGA